jgi:hypothetical protein
MNMECETVRPTKILLLRGKWQTITFPVKCKMHSRRKLLGRQLETRDYPLLHLPLSETLFTP